MTQERDDRETLVDSQLVGEAWPAVQPGEDPVLYGHVDLAPRGEFPVRSVQTFRLTYTAGRYGLDDTGAIRVAFRSMGDQGALQTTDPKAPNYVTAHTSTGVPLLVDYSRYGTTPRPRWKSLTVRVSGGYLREGDKIVIVFGDTSGGSPGMTLQTFVESAFEFKVTADVCAVGHYVPIPNTPNIAIVPDIPDTWRAVLPSLRRPGETFQLGVKVEDCWGNPTPLGSGKLRLEASQPVANLPGTHDFTLGTKAVTFENLSVAEEGVLRIKVLDEAGNQLCESHPLVVRDGPHGGYWGDLHGQSGESIGVSTSREYFDFARDMSFLDVTSHQANDFQVNNAFWAHLNELTADYHRDGRFVTFPGYEWSGNTGVGGDRNVYYRQEGQQIHRSSHALLHERDDLHTDAPTANHLFDTLTGKGLTNRDCFVYAHVGGRYADISYAHDGRLETAMEIHSAWGTFEWLLTDGFPLGHRSGVVCNSDGHKGRPGASYPGASMFGAYGGLTCFLTDGLSRDSIMDSLRRRHHYGTTGTRLHLDVRARFETPATLFDSDPNIWPDTATRQVDQVMMGDIVKTAERQVTLQVEAITQAPIERIDVLNGTALVQTLRGFGADDLGHRIRVLWAGAEYRGRGRDTHWKGRVRFGGARIARLARINAWNRELLFEQRNADTVLFEAVTTGNFGGFDAWLEGEDAGGNLEITTNLGSLTVPLAKVGMMDQIMEAGGLDRQIRAFRLPDDNPCRALRREVTVPLAGGCDNPLWVRVTTEDGFQAWSSPIFVFDGT